MKNIIAGLSLLACAGAFALNAAADTSGGSPLQATGGTKETKRPSDDQVRKILIQESIATYAGNCPCPYSRASNGSRCGRRSAYSREGGAARLCFSKDVTHEMVREYRDAHRE